MAADRHRSQRVHQGGREDRDKGRAAGDRRLLYAGIGGRSLPDLSEIIRGGEGPALDGRWALLCFLNAQHPGTLHDPIADQTTVSLVLRSRPLLTPVGVVFPDDALLTFRSQVDERLPLWPQGGGSVGDRMLRAALRAFRGGAERVLIMDGSVPDLPLSYILSAAQRLDRHDLLLGPGEEGGCYLVAMRFPVEEILIGVPWNGANPLQKATALSRSAGLETGFLPRWPPRAGSTLDGAAGPTQDGRRSSDSEPQNMRGW